MKNDIMELEHIGSGRAKRVVGICLACCTAIFIIGYLIYMAYTDIYSVFPFMRRYLSPLD